ncbi:MAG: DUF2007 domain-containing protein [Pseudomonadota bacterium]
MSLVELGGYSYPEAHIIIGRLESEGIPAIAFDAGTHMAEGSFRLIPVRVMVDEDDLAAARAVLAQAAG